MRVLCTVCARGGSKGILNKNIKPLLGKPLIVWSIEQAKNAGIFNRIVVSSDSNQILNIARDAGAQVFFKRAPELSGDEVGKISVIRDTLLKAEAFFNETYDVVVDLDVTSPLRTPKDIVAAFNLFIKNDYDNLFSVTYSKKNPYFNMVEIDSSGKVNICKKPDKPVKRRQDAPHVYSMNAAIYIWKREVLLQQDSLFLERTGIFLMDEEKAFDIDSYLDFYIVECLMKKRENDNR